MKPQKFYVREERVEDGNSQTGKEKQTGPTKFFLNEAPKRKSKQ